MSEPHSTPPDGRAKPAKPSPDFPLFPHAAGVWAKKIRGRLHYFGAWDDPDAALAKYNEQKDDLHAGREPRPSAGDLTVKEAVNDFLNTKKDLVAVGELTQRTLDDYEEVCVLLAKHVGKTRAVSDLRPGDFAAFRNKLAKRWGPHRLAKTVQIVRSLFKHAFDADLIDRPVRFGPAFARPTKKVMRLHRARQPPKLFTPEELRKLLAAAGPQVRAMMLLGINCGFGNADVGLLPQTALDLDGGWVNYPRPKTGVNRRCPLWPETVAAVREALACRPKPMNAEHAGLVFVTYKGRCWHTGKGSDTPLSRRVWKLVKDCGLGGRRGLNFYALRHTFRTLADEVRDQPAADFIMGHEPQTMAVVYREKIGDERLKAVTDRVRTWLFPPEEKAKKAGRPQRKAAGKKSSAEG
jgi:integrase